MVSSVLKKTTSVGSAAFRSTDVGLAADLLPEFRIGLDFEVAQGPLRCSLAPGFDPQQFLPISRSEKVFATLQGAIEATRAEIILSPFEQGCLARFFDRLACIWNLLMQKLLLGIDCVGGDDCLTTIFQSK